MKFYQRKEISQEKTPMLMTLGRRHTMAEGGPNEACEGVNNRASRTHSVGSMDQSIAARVQEGTSNAKRINFSPPSAVVITESELSSSWLYKDRKARINSDEECKREEQATTTTAAELDSNAKPASRRLKKVLTWCCHFIFSVLGCLAVLLPMVVLCFFMYTDLFNPHNETVDSNTTEEGNKWNASEENHNFWPLRNPSLSHDSSATQFKLPEDILSTLNSSEEIGTPSEVLHVKSEELLRRSGLVMEDTAIVPERREMVESSETEKHDELLRDNKDGHLDDSATHGVKATGPDDENVTDVESEAEDVSFSTLNHANVTSETSEAEKSKESISTVVSDIELSTIKAEETERSHTASETGSMMRPVHISDGNDTEGSHTATGTGSMMSPGHISDGDDTEGSHTASELGSMMNPDHISDGNDRISDTDVNPLQEDIKAFVPNTSDTDSTIVSLIDTGKVTGGVLNQATPSDQSDSESKPVPGALEFLKRLGFEPRNAEELPFLTVQDTDVKFSLAEALKYLRQLDAAGQLPTAREKSVKSKLPAAVDPEKAAMDLGTERLEYLNNIRSRLFD